METVQGYTNGKKHRPNWRDRLVTLGGSFVAYVVTGLVLFRWTHLLGHRSLADIVVMSFVLSLLLALFAPQIFSRIRGSSVGSHQR